MRQDMEDMVDMVEDMEEQGQSGKSLLGILLHTIIRRADFILNWKLHHFLIYMKSKQMTNIPAISYFSKHLENQLGLPCVTNKCA